MGGSQACSMPPPAEARWHKAGLVQREARGNTAMHCTDQCAVTTAEQYVALACLRRSRVRVRSRAMSPSSRLQSLITSPQLHPDAHASTTPAAQ